jgi:predicted metalloendopeptidase
MIANLKTAFKTLVDDATWMDDGTKAIAREKADYMSEFVGYPDWIKDKAALEAYYDGVIISYFAIITPVVYIFSSIPYFH